MFVNCHRIFFLLVYCHRILFLLVNCHRILFLLVYFFMTNRDSSRRRPVSSYAERLYTERQLIRSGQGAGNRPTTSGERPASERPASERPASSGHNKKPTAATLLPASGPPARLTSGTLPRPSSGTLPRPSSGPLPRSASGPHRPKSAREISILKLEYPQTSGSVLAKKGMKKRCFYCSAGGTNPFVTCT